MKTNQTVRRISVVAALAMLGACQAPTQSMVYTHPTRVHVADTQVQNGWTVVTVSAANLYIKPDPVLTNADLTGVQAGTNNNGEGLLALQLNAAGQRKLINTTTQYPSKRLALIVGNKVVAAPTYTHPVTVNQLIFPVGTEANATATARTIVQVSPGQPSYVQRPTPTQKNSQKSDALIYLGSQLMQQGQPQPASHHNYLIDGRMRTCTTAGSVTTCN